MRSLIFDCSIVLLFLTGTAVAQETWSPQAAAAYLDERSSWWMAWPGAARDHATFCVSCHTLAPYALSRPSLRSALSETAPSPNERKIVENIVKRVRMWNDVPSGHLSEDARLALDNMWALQLKSDDMSGSWAWLQFHNAPWEGDSQFYGTALAAVVVGNAPGDYKSEPGIQAGIKLMRSWLLKNMDVQTPADRLVLLWSSTKLPGLLTEAQQETIVAETLAKQREDGGFGMSSLVGSWKRRDSTPLDPQSDGYATGLVAFTLGQLGSPDAQPAVKRALAWLSANQNQADGRWPASSLNKQRELSSDAGRFMSDAATAYAVMALENSR
jgi:squalene-hopene/tetraprenyl-beta-curcumene cyclase